MSDNYTNLTGLSHFWERSKSYIDAADENLQAQIDAVGEPFRVKQFSLSTLNATLPCITEDIANTSIPNIDLSITGEEGNNYQIAGMLAFEVFDTNNARINAFPACQFTMNTQKTLRVRFMCAGTQRKVATRISCWVLLKHR